MSTPIAPLRETFHVEQPLATVWARLRPGEAPLAVGSPCRIPGFPSFDGEPGCAATVVAMQPQRSLIAKKADQPCAGSSIVIEVGPANAAGWPTRVTLTQSDLPPPMAAIPDAVQAHSRQIVADFQLYLEREVALPPAEWGPDFSANAKPTPLGLELESVANGGFAERCGMQAGDLLVALRGVRVRDLAQLWTVLALSAPGETIAAAWVRDELRHGSATL